MTQQHTPAAQASKAPAAASTAVAGPLTMRDLVVLGAVAIIFIASVVPMIETLTGDLNLWNVAGLFYLAIGVILPLVVAALFLIRRLSPEMNFRVGSLSVDQFASVVAAFATFFFFVGTVSSFEAAYLVGLIGSLAFLLATVCARWLPFFAADFADRAEVPAHVVARDAVAATKRPAAPKPVAPQANAAAPVGQGRPVAGGPATGGQQAAGQAAVHNAPQAQNTQGAWAGPQAAHTPAGQIFTPAKAAVPAAAGATAGASAATGAAAGASAASVQSAATTGAPTAAQASVPAAAGATAADSKPAGAGAGATAATPVTATAAGAKDAAAPAAAAGATENAATTLNPQVAESAKERTETAARESIAATVSPTRPAVVAEPFWFAVDRPQNVIDEKTRQFAFKLMPGAWILALEDRGESFLVQDSKGKTGLLLDLVGIERASDSQ